ncbi:MAG: HAD-IIB family hydrolase [Actinomycetota bacterium]
MPELTLADGTTRDVKAIVFDLDDTLAASKSEMHPAMTSALVTLLGHVEVCIISGGRFEQFEAQALKHLSAPSDVLQHLHLMPTCGTRSYDWQGDHWQLLYAEDLSDDQKSRAMSVLEQGSRSLGLWRTDTWGEILEDRGSQITYSALGQAAPVAEKMAWDPDGSKKRALQEYAASRLPDLEVRSGGSTSVDITRQGIDKAYGIRKLLAELDLTKEELLFIGDRLDPSGNDYPVLAMGVACLPVKDWHETLALVTTFNEQF